ncbi:hypothetical protein BH11BAC6_BH11BAC6_13880 [soil metagenome]
MTNISRLIILLCLIFSSVSGHTQNLILTTEQNNKWLDTLKTLQLEQQLLTVKERLLSDTNIFIRQSYPDTIRVVDPLGNSVYGDAKPMIIIGGYPMIIDNKTETSKIIGLTNLLSNKYISAIQILSANAPATTVIYGSTTLGGVIIMTLTKKKYSEQFTELKLKPNY